MDRHPMPRQAPEWYVISLRPQGDHLPLRHHARSVGARVFACSPLRVVARPDAALAQALACPRVVFTSPAAVRFAAQARGGLRACDGQAWLAVGDGTARALAHHGVPTAQAPARMASSEGVLALPPLQAVSGLEVGLVTAPGGRGVIEATLRERGARVVRADVYAREPVAIARTRLRRLAALAGPRVVLVSSAEALAGFLGQVPAPLLAQLRADPVVVSSERLEAIARQRGFVHVHRAATARPADLLAAAAHAVERGFG